MFVKKPTCESFSSIRCAINEKIVKMDHGRHRLQICKTLHVVLNLSNRIISQDVWCRHQLHIKSVC